MNVNITTKSHDVVSFYKGTYVTDRVTNIETITIKDVNSFSDMEDAFTQIAAFSESLFRDELEEDLKSMKLPDIPEQKGEAKRHTLDFDWIKEILSKMDAYNKHTGESLKELAKRIYEIRSDFSMAMNNSMFKNFGNVEHLDSFIKMQREISAQWNKFVQEQDKILGIEYDKLFGKVKIPHEYFPEPDPHDFLSSAKKPSAQTEKFMDGLKGNEADKEEYSYKRLIAADLYLKYIPCSPYVVEAVDVRAGLITSYFTPYKYNAPGPLEVISFDEYMSKLHEVESQRVTGGVMTEEAKRTTSHKPENQLQDFEERERMIKEIKCLRDENAKLKDQAEQYQKEVVGHMSRKAAK